MSRSNMSPGYHEYFHNYNSGSYIPTAFVSDTAEAELKLEYIINIEEFQELMDEFYKLTRLPMSIIDLEGNVLVGVGWQEICTNFHRVHPETYKHCLESDYNLSTEVLPGTYKVHKCRNNMWDMATPIMVNEKKIGSIFMGQFFFENDEVDYEAFRKQAREYGFDEEQYMAALEKVPRINQATVNQAMSFYTKLAHLISTLGHNNLQLIQAIRERIEAENALAKAYNQLDEEFKKAAEIQDKILPQKIPETDIISIAAYYQPAIRMGGDCYNVIRMGNEVVFFLSDVMGHGLDGALISVFVKEAIESYLQLKPHELEPQKIISHISNQYLSKNYPDEQQVSLFVGILDLETLELRYSCAGFHSPPLVKWGHGEWDKLDCKGIFISNIVPREMLDFTERSISLTPGTTILFNTDGLQEQSNGKEWFYQFYEEIFYRNCHLPPEDIIQALNNEFYLFNNNSGMGDDDITFMVLKVKEDSPA